MGKDGVDVKRQKDWDRALIRISTPAWQIELDSSHAGSRKSKCYVPCLDLEQESCQCDSQRVARVERTGQDGRQKRMVDAGSRGCGVCESAASPRALGGSRALTRPGENGARHAVPTLEGAVGCVGNPMNGSM